MSRVIRGTSTIISDDGKTYLQCPDNVVSVEIPSQIEIIDGKDKEHYSFLGARYTLTTLTFSPNSKLRTISPFAFYYCSVLQSIDLKQCSELTTISESSFEGCSKATTIILPENLQTLGVQCFKGTGVISLIIPSSVTDVGTKFLSECAALTSCTFAENSKISKLGEYLFLSSDNIRNLDIPNTIGKFSNLLGTCGLLNVNIEEGNPYYKSIDGVIYSANGSEIIQFPPGRTGNYSIVQGTTTVYSGSFNGAKIEYVTFPIGITTIGSWVFYSSSLRYLELPEGVKTISGNAFGNCQQLTTVILPNSVTTIGDSCFYNDINLTSVKLPSSLTTLGGGAFLGCNKDLVLEFDESSSLKVANKYIVDKNERKISMYLGEETNIVINKTYTDIQTRAFATNKNIQTVRFESGSILNAIGSSAFEDCANLISFEFPSTLYSISSWAFRRCSKLEEVHLNGVRNFGETTFIDCIGLKVFEIISPSYSLPINFLRSCTSLHNVTFSEGLQLINTEDFRYCTSLKEITLPSSLTKICDSAFTDSGLVSINFENPEESQLLTIGTSVFSRCYNLTYVTLPNSITSIGSYTFEYTNVPNFTIPESLTTIQRNCFQYCDHMEYFIIPPNSNLSEIEYGVFLECTSFRKIINNSPNFVVENEGLFNAERTIFFILPPMSPTKYFPFPTSVKTIRVGGLLGCRNLEIVLITQDSINEIQDNAFENCNNLRSINIPICVTKIGSNVFKGCNKLDCGLNIENRDKQYLDALIEKSLLPKRCVENCIKKCTRNAITNGKLSFQKDALKIVYQNNVFL